MINIIRVDAPYPQVVAMKSLHNVRCITNDYSANGISEFSAVSIYMYQSFVLSNSYPELSKMLEGVGISEMHHLELLADAIIASGGNPIFSGNNSFWNAKCLNYSQNPKEILKANIQAETCAIDNYRRSIQCVTNDSIKKLIERIIEDEKLHILYFEDALEQLEKFGEYKKDRVNIGKKSNTITSMANKVLESIQLPLDKNWKGFENTTKIPDHIMNDIVDNISLINKVVASLENSINQSNQDIAKLQSQVQNDNKPNNNSQSIQNNSIMGGFRLHDFDE